MSRKRRSRQDAGAGGDSGGVGDSTDASDDGPKETVLTRLKETRLPKRKEEITGGGGGSAPAPRRHQYYCSVNVSFVSADGSYGIGTVIQLRVLFSEVTGNGSMTLTLQLDGSTVSATASSDGSSYVSILTSHIPFKQVTVPLP